MAEVAAIILAAGQSTRAAGLKPLLPWGKQTFLSATVGALWGSGRISEIVLVTGHGEASLRDQTQSLAVRVVLNSNFMAGMHASIRIGLQNLQPGWDAAVVACVDQPQLVAADYRDYIDAFTRSGLGLGRPEFNGELGNPAIIGAAYLAEILREPDADRGCSYLFKRHPEAVARIPMRDNKCLVDFDTASALEAYRDIHLP